MQNLLILGGCGFVGSNLALYFKERGNNVIVFDNLVRRGGENNLLEFKNKGIKFIHGDVRNKEDFNNIPNKIDVILDCAAQPSAINYKNPIFDITNNTLGTINTLEYCRQNGCGLIFWSTNKCYTGKICNTPRTETKGARLIWAKDQDNINIPGFNLEYGFNEQLSIDGKDHSIYGVSKIMSDLMIQEWSDAYNIPSIINRNSCLAGPNQWGMAEQGWMAWFAIANRFNFPIKIFGWSGLQVRDYLFADDFCKLIEKQINGISKYRGEVFTVGGGKDFNTSILETVEFLEHNYKEFSKIEFDNTERRADQKLYISDIRKVSNAFDWSPSIDLKIGYEQIFNWITRNEDKIKEIWS